ncbi:replication initiation and membrane attachment family protein [Pontibacillus salicampi]|uniref:Replication initiation and membrane attachment family protein n=1 Tax=Pontibacillus salicampi TaxID=1449801 RepID=A0ABV6LJ14_9BACI
MHNTNIGKLLPVDGFKVQIPLNITVNMSTSLTHLYQPLIGMSAISFYQTLLTEYELQQRESHPRTHHLLMSYLHLPLDQLYEARKRLEAIGLLRTFLHQTEEETTYTYVLQKPFTPSEFFEDDMLSLLLYHHIGEEKYYRLRDAFYVKVIVEDSSTEVTSTFEEVFSLGEYQQDMPQAQEEGQSSRIVTSKSMGANLQKSMIDFNMLQQNLQQRMLPVHTIFTEHNKKIMNQLTLLYQLATFELEKAIQWSLTDENELDVTELKEACHDLYQSKQQQGSVQLTERRDRVSAVNGDSAKEKNTDDDKGEALIKRLEHISPRQLLVDLSDGGEPTQKELKTIRDIMTQQGLSAGVMNVLIYYVLLKTDMKLSKPYMETIAGHWARLQVKTVREAMQVAKSENQKYQQLANKRKSGNRKHNKEVLPDWFKDHQKEQNSKQVQQAEKQQENERSSEDIEREKQELAEALKNMDD